MLLPAALVLHAAISMVMSRPPLDMSEEDQKMAQMLHNDCLVDSGVDPVILDNAIEGKLVDDQKLKCYMKCLLVEIGAMDEETGELDKEAFLSVLPESKHDVADAILDKCIQPPGPDLCESAWKLNYCSHKADPENYLLI